MRVLIVFQSLVVWYDAIRWGLLRRRYLCVLGLSVSDRTVSEGYYQGGVSDSSLP